MERQQSGARNVSRREDGCVGSLSVNRQAKGRPSERGWRRRCRTAIFQNTKKLEDMHAANRFSDDEMKALMTEAVDYCYDFLMELCSPHGAEIIDDLKRRDELPEWNDPVPTKGLHL
jgi:hypothetical protein